MGILFLCLSNFEYICLIVLLVSVLSESEIRKLKRNWLITLFVTLLSSIGLSDSTNINIEMIIFIVLIIVAMKLLLVGNVRTIMIYTIIAVVLASISRQLLVAVMRVGAELLNCSITENCANICAQLLLLILVVWVSVYIRWNHAAEIKNIPLKYILIFMIVLLADCISLSEWGQYIILDWQAERDWFAELAYVLMGLGVFVQLGLLIALYFSRNAYRTQQALATKYLEEQVAHYQYLSEREQNTKRFRHDFKSHMAMAKQLYEEGKREEFEAYFHKMTEQIAAIGNRVTVNNDIADAIINRYYDEAALAGITMEVEGHFPGECYVSAYDLCTVLSNLLSNAIDAEKEAGGKTIYCGVRYDETQILIVVKNDYVNPIKRIDNRFVSTKGDLRHQGFGIANINEVVRKNNGHIFYDTADARFVVRLSLCNMKQNS